MSKTELVEETTFRDTFLNVMTLYGVLKAQPSLSIHRAELRQGEVTAEGVDFLADVEIKAKRVLNPTQFRLLMKFAEGGKTGIRTRRLYNSSWDWYSYAAN